MIPPISLDETKEAFRANIETGGTALGDLACGGAIGIFPGGTVSMMAKPFSFPMDPGWRSFTARMAGKFDAVVVPVFFGRLPHDCSISSRIFTTRCEWD